MLDIVSAIHKEIAKKSSSEYYLWLADATLNTFSTLHIITGRTSDQFIYVYIYLKLLVIEYIIFAGYITCV